MALGEASNVWRDLPEDLRPVRPEVKVADFSGDVVEISDRKLKAVFNNCYVSIAKGKKYRLSIVCLENGELKHYASGLEVAPHEVENLDLDPDIANRIKFYILFWDYILEKREAEIYLRARIRVAPKNISDRELLAEAIAKEVLRNRVVKTFLIDQGSKAVELGVYCYDGGYYRDCEEELKSLIERLVAGYSAQETKVTRWIVNEAVEKIKRRTQEKWRPARHKLLFKDRIFDWDRFIETGDLWSSLLDPSPEIYVEHRIPWRINLELWEKARKNLERHIPPASVDSLVEIFKNIAPRSYKAFLDWVKRSDESEEEARPKVALLLEVIGYTLYPHEYPFHKAILLVGGGSNGKSTYIKLIRTILGDANIASVNLRDLDPRYNRFAAAELYGKLANISTEPAKGINIDMNLFKQLTGEDPIRFERKFKEGFMGDNYAKMIFAANELPEVTEDTYAFWRRWIVIEFPNIFPPNPRFFEETFTPEEIEGVILCALHAYRLVMIRGGFTTLGTKDPKEEWLSRSNPVYRIVKKMLDDGIVELDPKGVVVKSDLYQLYKKYVEVVNEESGEEISAVLEQKDFTRHLTRLFPVKTGTPRIAGRKRNAYIGIRIKDYEKALKLVGHLETPRQLVEG